MSSGVFAGVATESFDVSVSPESASTRDRGTKGIIVITDAGPRGLGIGLYTQEGCLLAYVGYKLPFCAVESKHQNCREYLGYVLIFFFVEWVLGPSVRPKEVSWVGDNKAALSWANDNRCKSPAAQYAFLVVTWQQLSTGFQVLRSSHKRGIDMGAIDALSRDHEHSLDRDLEYIIGNERHRRLDALFVLMDPSVERNLDEHHFVFGAVTAMCRARP